MTPLPMPDCCCMYAGMADSFFPAPCKYATTLSACSGKPVGWTELVQLQLGLQTKAEAACRRKMCYKHSSMQAGRTCKVSMLLAETEYAQQLQT